MHRRLTTIAAALPLLVLAVAGPAGTSQGAAPASRSGRGIHGVTRTVTAGPVVSFPRPNPGTVGAPASPELNPAAPEEGDVGGGAAAARAPRSPHVAGGFTYNRRLRSTVRQGMPSQRRSAAVTRQAALLAGGFDGLDHFDSRTADGGNQFSNEPPDQALCVGSDTVVEAVNSAVQVYAKDGTGSGVTSLNRFLGLPSAIVRPDGPTGPTVFDPTCVFDPETRTFFLVADELAVDPATGKMTGQALLAIAVTKNPRGSWHVYHVDVTDDGRNGTPTHANCPCFGDYPHIGFDDAGFYITTNEFPQAGKGFDSAQVYAFDKSDLASGAARLRMTQFDTSGADRGNGGFTVWPAQSPSGIDVDRTAGGTAYFLSSNAVFAANGTSDTVVVWSLSDTSTLGQARPAARLHDARVTVDRYAVPPPVVQRPGAAPLLECLNDAACRPKVAGPGGPEVLQTLDSNDSRMQQVVLAGGHLYSALGTGVQVAGATHAGVAWFVLQPRSTRGGVSATLRSQGQLAVAGSDLTYPATGVTSAGLGVIGFTLAGRSVFPSAAFANLTAAGVGPVVVAAAGKGPQDGFTGYAAFNGTAPARPRWGDYGAAAVDGAEVWVASEYIGQTCTLAQYEAAPFGTCGGTRTALANWGTRVSVIRP